MSNKQSTMSNLTFSRKPVSRDDFISAARKYIGVPYVSGKAWVQEINGKMVGHCDCAGFPLLTIQRVGWLPADFPCDLPYTVFQRSRDDILHEMITTNMHIIPITDAKPGDIYFIRYPGTYEGDRGNRHFVIKSTFTPEPLGAIIHAWCDLRGEGKVFEQRLTQVDRDCIKSAYRFNNWRDD